MNTTLSTIKPSSKIIKKTAKKAVRKQGPVFVDLLDETRTIEPVGTAPKTGPNKGTINCRVYYDENKGKSPPVFHGFTRLPAKLFDDGTQDERSLTHSQCIGFLIKEKPEVPKAS